MKAILTASSAVLLALSGCGGNSAEAELEAASRELADARGVVEEALGEVKQREEEVAVAEANLTQARATLREAEHEASELESKIDLSATDALLFRSVQKRLLEDDSLEAVAILAKVAKGVVSLSWTVPEEKLRERAVEIARSTAGVASVQNRIQVLAPQGAN